MKIKDIMTENCCFVPHTATLQEAAQKMAEMDCGFMPVGKNDKLCGIVTDRDIAIRAVAKNLATDTAVSKIMSDKVLYCLETDSVNDIARNMSENRVRRLVVLNNAKDKKLSGIVSICDIVTAQNTESSTAHQLIQGVSRNNNSRNSKTGKNPSKAA